MRRRVGLVFVGVRAARPTEVERGREGRTQARTARGRAVGFLLGSGHTLTRSIRRRGRGCLAVAATDMGEGRPRG